ncbi:MAG: hypothetical protein FP814_15685, partial [Desulfobacterium sp.]|nr:hypothetical protein [Desulfobacterium sp.]MBU4037630.1 hypothetical protein [Pseudomonadota bacterium]
MKSDRLFHELLNIIEKLNITQATDLDKKLYIQTLYSLVLSLANILKTGAIIASPSKGQTPEEP